MLRVVVKRATRIMNFDMEDSIPGTRKIHRVVGTTPVDNVYFTFVKEKMQRLVIHPLKHYGWNQKGETVDVLQTKKNIRLKEVVDKLSTRVEGPYYAHYLRYAGHLRNLTEAKRLHEHVIKSGRKREEMLGHLIVKMYLDCGSLQDAKKVFYRMPRLDSVIWRDMLMTCAQYGDISEVLKVHRAMHQAGIILEKRVFMTVLYVCAKIADLEFAKQVHGDAVFFGVDSDILVANALISVYARCGRLDIAKLVFDAIQRPNVPSWNALIGAYVRYEYYEEVFEMFQRMSLEGYIASPVTYSAVLSACIGPAYLNEGMFIDECCQQEGLDIKVVPGSALIRMYGKCGSVHDAQTVFDNIQGREVTVWTNMIDVYVQRGFSQEAFTTYDTMQIQRVAPNKITYITLLNACNSPDWLEKGRVVHSYILREGWESDPKVGAALIKMYGACGNCRDARRVFRKLQSVDVLVWNAVIQCHLDALYCKEALSMVWKMHIEGVKGDSVSYAAGFSACEQLGALEEGRKMHSAIRGSVLETEVLVGSSLIKFYGSYGDEEGLDATFRSMNWGKLASWNAVIWVHAEYEYFKVAVRLFRLMQLEGAPPDSETFVAVLGAVDNLEVAKFVHKYVVESGYETTLSVGNALLDMFGRMKILKLAKKTFEAMTHVNVISWTKMIEAYSICGFKQEAVKLFQEMLQEGYDPDRTCLAATMRSIMEQEDVLSVHSVARELGLDTDPFVGAALVDVYAKCSDLEQAQEVFECIQHRDVRCWNTLLKAYVQEGRSDEALELFQEMQVEPDSLTFVTVIEAAIRVGDVDMCKRVHNRAVECKLENHELVAESLRTMFLKMDSP